MTNTDRDRRTGSLVAWLAIWVSSGGLISDSASAQVISAGAIHNLVISNDGAVVGWGSNFYGQSNGAAAGSGNMAIAAGNDHSLALKNDGTVVGWGANNYGQANGAAAGGDNVAIASGETYGLALKNDGTVVGWGQNELGGTNGATAGGGNVAIAAGNGHSLALKNGGTVVGWGLNDDGQANGAAASSGNVAIDAGWFYSLALKNDGTVVGWGYNLYGQANGAAAGTNVVAISAGGQHSLALRNDGTVVAWGRNQAGQLAVPLGLVAPTDADWSNPAGGNFLGSHNWRNKTPSTAMSDATFQINATYAVDFNTNARARSLDVTAGDVTFNLNGFTYQVGQNATIGNNATLTISNGALQVSGAVIVDTQAAFGARFEQQVALAGAYGGITTISNTANATEARLLAGQNTTGGTEFVSMRWRTPEAGSAFASDILELSGMTGGFAESDRTDPFVLQMKYNPALVSGDEASLAASGQIYVSWFDPEFSVWSNAVDGNYGGSGFFVLGDWTDFGAAGLADDLGRWGINSGTNTVWAVLNHNSEFSVNAVPEPSALALFGLTGCAFFVIRALRKRRPALV